MAKNMWSDALATKRRTSLAREGDVLVEQVFDTVGAESTAVQEPNYLGNATLEPLYSCLL
jgi:hypothetical protein